MQAVLDLVWSVLLPALGPTALPADAAAHEALTQKLASLALAPVQGEANSSWATRVSGKRYHFERNPRHIKSAMIEFGPQGCTLEVRDARGAHRVSCGLSEWREGSMLPIGQSEPMPVATSGAWTAENTFTVRQCYVEAPFVPTMTFQFGDDNLTLAIVDNVSFGPTEHPPLIGRLSASK